MADRPMRIQRRRTKGWKMPEGTVYVGRPSRWGNGYRVGADHSYYLGAAAEKATAAQCVALYATEIDARLTAEPDLRGEIDAALRGRDLACWCRLCPRHAAGKPFAEACPDCAPCHADVLGRLANGLSCDSPPANGEQP